MFATIMDAWWRSARRSGDNPQADPAICAGSLDLLCPNPGLSFHESAEQVARTTAGKNAAVQVTSDGPYAHVTVTRPVELLGLVTLSAEHSAQARARVEHLPKDPRP